jgi:WD40 repeat protein
MAGRRREKRGPKEGVDDAAAAVVVCETPAQAATTAIKTRIAELNRRDTEALEQIERLREQIQREERVRDEVAVEMTQANTELDTMVAAPIPSGEDPTAWLPDELLILILLQVGWMRGCDAVCRRWRGLCRDVAVQRQLRDGRWEEYAAGSLAPRELRGDWGNVESLALGPNETVYASCDDYRLRVWSTRDGQLLQTFEGLAQGPLAVAQDGTLYAAYYNCTVHVLSGESGVHLRTLRGHTVGIVALAIGANGNVFSGSVDRTIRMWSGRDGAHLHTLAGHTSRVTTLAVGRDKVYSGSRDTTVRVWSVDDGKHLQTLTGHTGFVTALALGPDGTVFSGSRDTTVRVWSGDNGTHLRTLQCGTAGVCSLAVGQDDMLFISNDRGTVQVWRAMGSASRCTFSVAGTGDCTANLCLSASGTLYSCIVDRDVDEDEDEGGVDGDGVIQIW